MGGAVPIAVGAATGALGGKGGGKKAQPTSQPIYGWSESSRKLLEQMGLGSLFPAMQGGLQNIMNVQQGNGPSFGGGGGAANRYWGAAHIDPFEVQKYGEGRTQGQLAQGYGRVKAQQQDQSRAAMEQMARMGIAGPRAATILARQVTAPASQQMADITQNMMENQYNWVESQREFAKQMEAKNAEMALQKGIYAGSWGESAADRAASMYKWGAEAPLNYGRLFTEMLGPQQMQSYSPEVQGGGWRGGLLGALGGAAPGLEGMIGRKNSGNNSMPAGRTYNPGNTNQGTFGNEDIWGFGGNTQGWG